MRDEYPGSHTLEGEPVKLFTGNANPQLARDIADYLRIPLGKALVSKFKNGETQVKIEENVRGQAVFVIQQTSSPANDSIMELLIMIDALRRSSAARITAVIPCYGYAKQEKKTSGREPISAKLVANLITVAGASRIITVDLHAAAIQGFFDIPVDNLYALPVITSYIKKKYDSDNWNLCVVSPDAGGVARARAFAEALGASLAIIFKRRPRPDMVESLELVGDVKGKTALMIDDMISTGGTVVEAAGRLMESGAKEVYACVTHAIFAEGALEKLLASPLKEVVITDTVPLGIVPRKGSKITVLSVASLLGEAICRNHFNLSVSKLFDSFDKERAGNGCSESMEHANL